jgi:hypothetical protein
MHHQFPGRIEEPVKRVGWETKCFSEQRYKFKTEGFNLGRVGGVAGPESWEVGLRGPLKRDEGRSLMSIYAIPKQATHLRVTPESFVIWGSRFALSSPWGREIKLGAGQSVIRV